MKIFFFRWICIFAIIFTASGLRAERINLTCEAAKFKITSEIEITKENKKLEEGFVRYISPSMSAFFNTNTYSNRTSYECAKEGQEEDKNSKRCIGMNNNIFCKNPRPRFELVSTKDDNSIVMVSNRCDGAYKKFARIDGRKTEDIILVDDKFRYQLKHQHIAGTETQKHPPVLRLRNNGNTYDLWIEAFQDDHWQEDDPGATGATSSLMISVDEYSASKLDQYSIKTICELSE